MTTARDDARPAIALLVGERVRSLRTGRRWSLDELAGRSGVSKGMLVQIEAGRTNPSIGTLVRIADAFGVTVARLVEEARPPEVQITGPDDYSVLWEGPSGGRATLFAGVDDPEFVEFWEWVLEPGEEHVSEDHSVGTREIAHVVAGTMTLVVGDLELRVATGRTAVYPGDVPHRYRNDGDTAARVHMVVTMPPGEFDRRTRR
ncbi:helix-turn-helix domain-containing protein [Cryptosporangium arvum]|uniref:Putative transcriptional regulator n=1 Tax=Cryptosporangium arvum DSM 44712 TaxID=927661 RepID=A0A011AEA6_9ACTN|nr:XRE family transcriptional regulator [Cryptosporangium arvum]EXG80371.1 putative transcriptional regulator [Cryptosporangium arvum DSM 44712]